MSQHGSAYSSSKREPIQPRRLELSVNPEDGSLSAAPLLHVLLASTDALYNDLYNMAEGELDVTTARDHEEENAAPTPATKKERMSNLSFAQRRHELQSRLHQHGKALQHVAALTAAQASSDLSSIISVSSRALQHARSAWMQADEAQDALYFFHAQLFPSRAPPHDIYGSLDVQLLGQWLDMPHDLRLTIDRYQASEEAQWRRSEVDAQWQMAVRDKLVRGEVGWNRLHPPSPTMRFDLRLDGGILRLTHGPKKTIGGKECYPIAALLTVLSSTSLAVKPPEWTLLSLEVTVRAKTGEFNHQLETSNRQRYDLHRLAMLAMVREEARARKAQEEAEKTLPPAHPLDALFSVAQTFLLSWQLELLSAQAQALRRGVWAAGESNPIHVTPVRFINDSEILGVVSISFWRVDDSYGPPSMGDLSVDLDDGADTDNMSSMSLESVNSTATAFTSSTNQLILSIRADKKAGIRVSLSGAGSVMSAMASQPHLRSTTEEILRATSNPLELSVSEALLAATHLCAERKCFAVAMALQPPNKPSILPRWILLSVERGSIAVAARVKYHGVDQETNEHGMPILFRLTCDSRTGSFVNTFPRQAKLLSQLACNRNEASEAMAVRIASLPPNRRRAAGVNATGRVVRDAFDGLTRSMNMLGQRTGVGGTWDDLDNQSGLLRERAILAACSDVKLSLIKCCGMAALYGLFPLALSASVGLEAVADMYVPFCVFVLIHERHAHVFLQCGRFNEDNRFSHLPSFPSSRCPARARID